MVIFKNKLKRKSDPNIHQNAPFKKNLSGGHAPEPPLQSAWRRHAQHVAS